MHYILIPCFLASVTDLIASVVDGATNVPLTWVMGCLSGVLFAGMWVSSKVTRFEEQQQVNIQRLNAIDARLCIIDEKQDEFHGNLLKLVERVAHGERRRQ